MALTRSVDQVAENGRELLTYGTTDFPIAFFDDDLTEVLVPAHWHEEWELVLITGGSTQVRLAGNSFLLTAGQGYFANSGTLHAETLKSESGHQHAMVFSPSLISPAEDRIYDMAIRPVLGNPRLPYVLLSPSASWKKEVLDLAEKAWQAGAYDQEEGPIQVRYGLSRILYLIASRSEKLEQEMAGPGIDRRDEDRIKKALLFIQEHFSEDMAIQDIAESADISVSTCLRLFRAALDTTPVRYLIDYRLQEAMEELKRKDGRTISEIAYACGFSDASYFNRCFKKAFSMPPTQYRGGSSEHSARSVIECPYSDCRGGFHHEGKTL